MLIHYVLFQIVLLHMNNLLEEMVKEEENMEKRLIASVENYRQELQNLCDQLHLPPHLVCVSHW